MKTTIDIADPLLEKTLRVAAREKTTVKALVEAGLRAMIEEKERPHTFRLRKAAFKGQGFQATVQHASWDGLREMAYSGRGG